jgi:hypothetical protein
MLAQSNQFLEKALQERGSYLLALFYVAHKHTSTVFTVEEINYKFNKYISLGWCEKDAYVVEADKILNDLGVKCMQNKYKEKEFFPKWWGPSHDIEILFFMGNCIDVYAVSDKNGNIEWCSTTIGPQLYLVSKRLFTLEENNGYGRISELTGNSIASEFMAMGTSNGGESFPSYGN